MLPQGSIARTMSIPSLTTSRISRPASGRAAASRTSPTPTGPVRRAERGDQIVRSLRGHARGARELAGELARGEIRGRHTGHGGRVRAQRKREPLIEDIARNRRELDLKRVERAAQDRLGRLRRLLDARKRPPSATAN